MRKTGLPGRVSWRKCNWVILDEKVGVNQVGGEWICKGIRNLRGAWQKPIWLEHPWFAPQGERAGGPHRRGHIYYVPHRVIIK